MRKVFSLLMALLIVMSLAVPALAADGSITYYGKSKILLTPGMTTYTDSDMFADFKGVMPGDVLTESVKITNLSAGSDYVRVYFRAIPHGVTNQPSKKVTEAGETLESMEKFLKQLKLEVKQGDEVVFSGTPNLGTDRIFLRDLRRFKSTELSITLTVPKEMGNEFANREGEVDWEFTFEGRNYPEGEAPSTGDYIMMAVTVMTLSAAALVAILALKRRKKH